MSHFPTLETERLWLRELTLADAADLLAIQGDPEVMRWFGADPLADIAAAEKLISMFAGWRKLPNPGVRFGLERKADGRLLGTCGLFSWHRAWRKCSTGYELGTFAWGQGYMREALTEALRWGFASMELNRVEAQIHPRNTASLKLVRSLGFVEEGLLREVGYWAGAPQDLLQFSLLRREFLPAGAKET